MAMVMTVQCTIFDHYLFCVTGDKSGHDRFMTTSCVVTGAKHGHDSKKTTSCFVTGAKEWS